jgi:hypothetical protein
MEKLSTNQKIAIGGFIVLIVSVFLPYLSPKGADSLSLYSLFAKSEEKGGYDAAIWIIAVLALAAAGGYLVYATKRAGAFFAASLLLGFLGACFIIHDKMVDLYSSAGSEISIGIGAYLGLVAAVVAVYGTFRTFDAR